MPWLEQPITGSSFPAYLNIYTAFVVRRKRSVRRRRCDFRPALIDAYELCR